MRSASEAASQSIARRPLRTRDTWCAKASARGLMRLGLRPNQVSVMSAAFGCMAGGCLILSSSASTGWRIVGLLAAAALQPARAICNLLDGLMAIEGGLKTRSGEVFNDLPDRISDIAALVGAGYSITSIAWGAQLGFIAALLAVMTAYVRLLGGAAGLKQDFCGPMAKQHRIAVLTTACIAAALETALHEREYAMPVALVIISMGSLITLIRRTRRIVAGLESRTGGMR